MTSPTPYTIDIPQEAVDKVKQRLELSTFPDELDAQNQWQYGAPLSDIKRLANYWKNDFDWRKAEEKLNKLPQFTSKVQVAGFGDVELHFIHQKSEVENAIPLLFCHGCEDYLPCNPAILSEPSSRAGFVHRSHETATVTLEAHAILAGLSCRCTISAKFWMEPWHFKTRFRTGAVR
jgi:hypothetical protein